MSTTAVTTIKMDRKSEVLNFIRLRFAEGQTTSFSQGTPEGKETALHFAESGIPWGTVTSKQHDLIDSEMIVETGKGEYIPAGTTGVGEALTKITKAVETAAAEYGSVSQVTLERVLREIEQRRGQQKWSRSIKKAWGFDGPGYEAAHVPGLKSGELGEGNASDGIPIISIHTLFDRWLEGKGDEVSLEDKNGTLVWRVRGKARKFLQSLLAGEPINVPENLSSDFKKNLSKTARGKKGLDRQTADVRSSLVGGQPNEPTDLGRVDSVVESAGRIG